MYALLIKIKDKWFPIALDIESKELAKRKKNWQEEETEERDTYKICSLSEVKKLLQDNKIDFECFTEKAKNEKIDFIKNS